MAPDLAESTERLSPAELREAWPLLLPEDRLEAFRSLDQAVSDDFFLSLSARNEAGLLMILPEGERRLWMRLLAPDDAADVIQNVPQEEREGLLALLDDVARHEVRGLLAYAEDDAGGLMNPRFARVRPDMTTDEAIIYLRRQVSDRAGSFHYAYVTDQDQKLAGVISFRELLGARPDQHVNEIMRTSLITVPESMDQEEVSRLFSRHHLVEYFDMIRGIVREGQKRGEFRAEMSDKIAANCFFGALDEMVTSWVLSEHDYRLAGAADAVVDVILAGMESHPGRR